MIFNSLYLSTYLSNLIIILEIKNIKTQFSSLDLGHQEPESKPIFSDSRVPVNYSPYLCLLSDNDRMGPKKQILLLFYCPAFCQHTWQVLSTNWDAVTFLFCYFHLFDKFSYVTCFLTDPNGMPWSSEDRCPFSIQWAVAGRSLAVIPGHLPSCGSCWFLGSCLLAQPWLWINSSGLCRWQKPS